MIGQLLGPVSQLAGTWLNGKVEEAKKQMNGGSDGNGSYLMPFGKHKGTPVNQLDHDYVKWCIHNILFKRLSCYPTY